MDKKNNMPKQRKKEKMKKKSYDIKAHTAMRLFVYS